MITYATVGNYMNIQALYKANRVLMGSLACLNTQDGSSE